MINKHLDFLEIKKELKIIKKVFYMAKYKRKKLVKKNRTYAVNLEKTKKKDLRDELKKIYTNDEVKVTLLPKSRKKI